MTAALRVRRAPAWPTPKVSDNLSSTLVYAYAGALAPNGDLGGELRDELATRYRQSVAARAFDNDSRVGNKVDRGLQMDQRAAVSQQDLTASRSTTLIRT